MYNKNDILLKLNSENYYIDRRTLSAFITSRNIEAVYENEQKETIVLSSFYSGFGFVIPGNNSVLVNLDSESNQEYDF